MPESLYFIRIIADALRCPDLDAGMREALALILERRDDPQYHLGFQQFLRFIDVAASSDDEFEQEEIAKVTLRMLLTHVMQDLLHPRHLPGEQSKSEEWHGPGRPVVRAMQGCATRSAPLNVQIQRDQDLIALLPLPLADPAVILNLRPGSYTIALDTGRRLWSGELGPADLVWHRAFPGRPFPVAADTAIPSATPTRRIPLVVGVLTAVVYPGMEIGSMRLVAGAVA